MRQLLGQLEETGNGAVKTREKLLGQIAAELEAHTTIEEEIFYPAFKEAGEKEDSKLYFEAVEEHHAAGDLVLPDLQDTDPKTEAFAGRVKVLKDLIEHHVKEEEKEMFPRARKLLGKEQLEALGEAMAQRKQELLAAQGGQTQH